MNKGNFMRNLEKEPSTKKLELFAIPGIPIVKQGDNIAGLILEANLKTGLSFQENDIVVIAQKIVSKAEGRTIPLSKVVPSKESLDLAKKTGRDPRLCQVVIEESKKILYTNGRAIITEHRLGFVDTSSGVDRSNSDSKEGEIAILLPLDPDKSARKMRDELMKRAKKNLAVIISDSFGRPWRKGSVGMAIGVAGIKVLHSLERKDLAKRSINPEIALVDEIAGSASILMGEADEGLPVVIVRGVNYLIDNNPQIKDLLRPPEEDQIWE